MSTSTDLLQKHGLKALATTNFTVVIKDITEFKTFRAVEADPPVRTSGPKVITLDHSGFCDIVEETYQRLPDGVRDVLPSSAFMHYNNAWLHQRYLNIQHQVVGGSTYAADFNSITENAFITICLHFRLLVQKVVFSILGMVLPWLKLVVGFIIVFDLSYNLTTNNFGLYIDDGEERLALGLGQNINMDIQFSIESFIYEVNPFVSQLRRLSNDTSETAHIVFKETSRQRDK
uniref:Uncharacterized protein n=1 Tax=Cacopsylla melanoneura TaxID=428564 RepID=A0A8D8ZBT2_9HEMI